LLDQEPVCVVAVGLDEGKGRGGAINLDIEGAAQLGCGLAEKVIRDDLSLEDGLQGVLVGVAQAGGIGGLVEGLVALAQPPDAIANEDDEEQREANEGKLDDSARLQRSVSSTAGQIAALL
jgi:hypothetical protein